MAKEGAFPHIQPSSVFPAPWGFRGHLSQGVPTPPRTLAQDLRPAVWVTHLDHIGDSWPQHLLAGVRSAARGPGQRLVAGPALPGGAHAGGLGASPGGRAATVRGRQAGRAAAARKPRARPLPGSGRQAAQAGAGEFQVGHLVEQVAQAAGPIVRRLAQRLARHQVGGRRGRRLRDLAAAAAFHRQIVEKVIDRCHRVIPEAVVLGAWKHAPP